MLHAVREMASSLGKVKGNSLVSTINDTIVGVGAASSPFWVENVVVWAQDFLIVGGAFLLVVRIIMSIRNLYLSFRDGKKSKDEE